MASETRVQEGGPMERSHMKDMVLKNALESAALIKASKHLESQKRAFVRQTTRDEEEMKNLLCRLHVEQHNVQEEESDEEAGSEVKSCSTFDSGEVTPLSRFESEPLSNPYPVTIIPRFGGRPRNRKPAARHSTSRLGQFRRKSVEYEDIQESLTSMTVSDISVPERSVCGSTSCIPGDTALGDWLATPDAISSVRRMRKSVTEQTLHKKLLRKSSTDSQHSVESLHDNSTGSRGSPSRNGSLRERQRTDSERGSTPPSPRKIRVPGRTASLRDMKVGSPDSDKKCNAKVFMRSFSMLSKANITNVEPAKKLIVSRPNSERKSFDIQSKIKRKNSKKGEKKTLTRKSSNDSIGSIEGSPLTRSRRHNSGKSGISDDGEVLDEVFKF